MEIDVANNIKAVEQLKVELLQAVTDLMADIVSDSENETDVMLANDFASIEIISALLKRRLGVDKKIIDSAVIRKLNGGIKDGHFLEERFGDLTNVLNELSEGQIDNEKYEG